jgi:hypothetical protein
MDGLTVVAKAEVESAIGQLQSPSRRVVMLPTHEQTKPARSPAKRALPSSTGGKA